jgi:hypothetical protein
MSTSLISSPVWGRPIFDTSHATAARQRGGPVRTIAVQRQLHAFLADQISDFQPDLIIVHERKGTAIVRALIEYSDFALEWPWRKIISSASIDQLSPDAFAGRRILVFDDMIRTGRHVSEVLESLRHLLSGQSCTIRVAVFAMHEEAATSAEVVGLNVSYSWFYRSLCDPAYRGLRAEIISLLQETGSLMLDTEHIELRLTLNASFSKLVDALSRKANAVVFNSLGQRTNLTVYYGDDQAHQLDPGRFPTGVITTNIVKKCRFVQREADEFAIIPICLPSVPVASEKWRISAEDGEILGEAHRRSDGARFYGTALLGSLSPLFWALRDLYASDPKAFTISLPSLGPSHGNGEYTLDHLMVMYPTIDVARLVQHIAAVDRQARTEGAQLRRIRAHPTKTPFAANADLHREALQLLQLIAHTLDVRRSVENQNGYNACQIGESPTGLTIAEIFRLGKRFKWHEAHISALFDVLIDDGNLITRVERCNEGGALQWTRTFRPDGEVVSELIRRYTIQWGLPDAT